ncbi:MAG: FecR domain-containing protein, partial [Candidatus Thiodiazotropha sp. (ex Semelilucina semeliformis)]|nr:FecR domain-containing protein [Candidatus Thiodiazotropha sp. (ex Semelilucina semeliformis)]
MLRRSLILITCLFISLLSLTVAAEDWVYRLHQGETLTLVAERFLKPEFTPEQLQVYNGILNDREIPVGTEIRVPIDWMDQALEGVEVRFVFGEAELFRRGQAEAETVARGTMLKAGDRVVTAEKSAVSLAFADGTHLLVGPKSEVVFDALSAFKGRGMLDTRIRLQRGRLENRVKPIKRSGSRYEIHTPAAVTVVRGTDFRVSVEPLSELTRSEVTEGEVSVSASGETVAVTAGEGTLIEPGQPPETPRRLLD